MAVLSGLCKQGMLFVIMIDPHVHFRDWQQSHKETVNHGLAIAHKAGLSGIFEMPNTEPPILSRRLAEERIALADAAKMPVFHGLYMGLTADAEQLRQAVKAWQSLFPRVVGLKLFAGRSTGSLSVIKEEEQQQVYRVLAASNYRGVIAVHCEKEACFVNQLRDPQQPASHCLVRPPVSEVESVRDQIRFAARAEFKGTLHICHISTPQAVFELEQQREKVNFCISCGLTPHHALLNSGMMQVSSVLKINPPLRTPDLQQQMLALLQAGRISWIETDHAPHLLADKPLASGIPGLPFLPHFLRYLRNKGMDETLLTELTHHNICRVFRIGIENQSKPVDYSLAAEYEFDPYADFRSD